MKLRKLTLDDGVWRYRITETMGVEVWSACGKKHRVKYSDVFTICMCSCPPEYQCFGKGFSPGALRGYIEKHLI